MTFCHFEWNLFMWTSLLKCKYLAIIAGMPKSAVMMMTTRRQWWRWLFQYWTSSRENRNQSGMLAAPAVNWSLYWKGCQSSIRSGEANVSRCRKGLIKMKIYLSFMMYIYIHMHYICICLSSEQGSRHPELYRSCYAKYDNFD